MKSSIDELRKDEVRQRIVDAAKEEFLLSGYARASMRSIASQAGMTVGNIYLYFTGKEQLFDEVVSAPVEAFRRILRLTSPTDETIRRLAMALRDVFVSNRVEFLILILRSGGSKYESYKTSIVDFAQHRMAEQFAGQPDDRIFGPLAVAIIEGLLYIFNRFDGEEESLTADLILFLNYMLSGLIAARRQTEAYPCEK